MTATQQPTATTYDLDGRLLEVCNCDAICPCWVGEDPDNGTCESVLAWYVDRGTVEGVDVADRALAAMAHIPGNVFAGGWKVALLVDDRCSDAQQEALLKVFTGQLGGAMGDFAALIGEVVAVERAPMTFTVEEGKGTLKVGHLAEARLAPFQGATGTLTTLSDTVFSTIPGSPTYPGKAELFRMSGKRYGLADVNLSGKNSIQGHFRLAG